MLGLFWQCILSIRFWRQKNKQNYYLSVMKFFFLINWGPRKVNSYPWASSKPKRTERKHPARKETYMDFIKLLGSKFCKTRKEIRNDQYIDVDKKSSRNFFLWLKMHLMCTRGHLEKSARVEELQSKGMVGKQTTSKAKWFPDFILWNIKPIKRYWVAVKPKAKLKTATSRAKYNFSPSSNNCSPH